MRARAATPAATAWLAACALLLSAPPSGATTRVLDPFEDSSRWSAVPASGVLMKLTSEPGETGRALRIDFDFQKGGGYAVLHRALDLALPANYRFSVRVRGATAPQDFEFKLIDASGENVWWKNRRGFVFPGRWETVATRKRQVEFAWGPAGGGEMTRVAAIEFAITAGSGGKGTVWLDELSFEELPPGATPPPVVASASSARPGRGAARAADGDSLTAWRPAAGAGRAWLQLDLGIAREFGGLVLDWGPGAASFDYDIRVATEPGAFRTVRRVLAGNGRRDWLFLPECEARWIRIECDAARTPELRECALRSVEWSATLNRFYEAIARDFPRGAFPRGMLGEMQFWSVVGAAGGREECLFSEDGAADAGAGRFSLEPFIWSDGRLSSWADAVTTHSLREGDLPIPTATRRWRDFELEITATPLGEAGASSVRLDYHLSNRGGSRATGTLFLAVRPFQVNPPAQFLNGAGGAVEIRSLARHGDVVDVDGRPALRLLTPAAAFGAATFDGGDIFESLSRGRLPPHLSVDDPFAHASGALAYPFALAPGEARLVVVEMPLDAGPAAAASAGGESPDDTLETARAAAAWRRELGPAEIRLPPSAHEVERTLSAQIGWIEVNRDGPAIQPGSRAYARSWIRDGSLTSSALLRWGRHEEVKEFLEWFAPHQYADGKVPCCVDRRGSDPVPEHDSHGQLIYLAAEYLRHTGDTVTVRRLWPHVAGAAAYLDTLRSQRLGAEWRDSAKREFLGILPPSISHEGYSAKPMHSYWDDFWAARGYADAVFLARALGHTAAARRIDASRTAFRRAFSASIAAARERHGIDYVPGSADLGDFDATSTTIALSPAQAEDLAPPGAIEATFERYWRFFTRRRDGLDTWEAFTPYEIRNIGAFVRLGWRDRAQELTSWFLAHRSPPGWAQWAEVVWNTPPLPAARFIGDLPHTWVGSDFVRSVLDMLAYERERDDALVVGAGVPAAWVREPPGVSVRNLDTWYGPLTYHMKGEGRAIRVEIGPGLRVPRGGIVLAAPGVTPRWIARVNGRPATVNARGEVVLRALPATVVLAP